MDQVQTLQEQLEIQRFQHRSQLGQILTQQREAFDLLEREFGQQVAALGVAHAKALAQVQRTDTKYEAALQQCENQYEKQVAKARLAFLDKQKLLAEKCEELKAGEELEMRKVKKLNLRLQALQERYNSTTQAQLSMAMQCEGRDRKLIEMQQQLQEREDVIRAKEATIRQLRQLNSQLENFRFVLDQKLLAMQSEQEPMQAQLRHLEAHVQRMFQEMVKATQERQRLQKDNAEKERRAKALHSQLEIKAQSVRSLKYKLDGILADLTFMLAHHRDSFDLAQRLAILFRKHAPDCTPPAPTGEQQKGEKAALPVQDELKRQRDWLDKKLQTVVDRHKKLEQQKNEHIQRIQRENCKLIEECNVLRNDNQTIAKKVVELEKRLRTIAGARDAADETTSLASGDLNGLASPGAAFLRRASQNPRATRKPFLSRVEAESSGPLPKHLLTNIQKNKEAIEGQGRDMVRLEQRMNVFLAEEGGGAGRSQVHQQMNHVMTTQNTHTEPDRDEQSLSGDGGRSFSPIHPQRPQQLHSPQANPEILKNSPPHGQFRGASPTRPNASVGSQPSISNILQHKYSIHKSSSTHQARKFFRDQSPPQLALNRQDETDQHMGQKKFSVEYRSPSQASPPRSPRLLSAEHARNAPSLLSPQALRDSQHPPTIQLPSLKGTKKFKSRRNSSTLTPQVGGFSGGKKLGGGGGGIKSVKSLRRGTSPTPPPHH